MNTIDHQFNALAEKLQHLLKQQGQLQRENAQLQADLLEARNKEAAAQAQIEALNQQAAILKFAAGGLTDREKKEFERTISRYIRQIDKTIAYLSQ